MSAFKLILAAALAVALARPSMAGEMDMYGPGSDEPTGARMIGDALVARPLYAAATAFGAAVFLVTLPFSALGGNVDQAANELVAGPARVDVLEQGPAPPAGHHRVGPGQRRAGHGRVPFQHLAALRPRHLGAQVRDRPPRLQPGQLITVWDCSRMNCWT